MMNTQKQKEEKEEEEEEDELVDLSSIEAIVRGQIKEYCQLLDITSKEERFILKLHKLNVAGVVGKIPDVNRQRPVVRDTCQRLVNYKLNYGLFEQSQGWEEEYLMFCLNSFVCSGGVYRTDSEHELDRSIMEEIKEDESIDNNVRRTQCMYCRAVRPCMSLDKTNCSKSSPRMRCDALSCVHLCNSHGLRFGVSVGRQPTEDLQLEDGRVLKTTFHIAKKKKSCNYELKGKRTVNKKEFMSINTN